MTTPPLLPPQEGVDYFLTSFEDSVKQDGATWREMIPGVNTLLTLAKAEIDDLRRRTADRVEQGPHVTVIGTDEFETLLRDARLWREHTTSATRVESGVAVAPVRLFGGSASEPLWNWVNNHPGGDATRGTLYRFFCQLQEIEALAATTPPSTQVASEVERETIERCLRACIVIRDARRNDSAAYAEAEDAEGENDTLMAAYGADECIAAIRALSLEQQQRAEKKD